MARFFRFVLPALLLSIVVAPFADAQSGYDKFRNDFDQAAKLGAKSRMDELMKKSESDAIYAIIVTAEAISKLPNDVLYDRFTALKETWARVYDTDFPDDMEVYFANLDPTSAKERFKLTDRYRKAVNKQIEATNAKDGKALFLIADEMETLADAFDQLGDFWYQSQALLSAGVAVDETHQGNKADLKRATKNFEVATSLREKLGVKDRLYRETVPRMKKLQALGFGSAPKEGGDDTEGGGSSEPAAASAGSAITAKMEFEQFKKLDDLNRPSYYLDEHYQIWPTVSLTTVGSSLPFPRISDGPTVIRDGASKVLIDQDNDGEGDIPWPLRGKVESITMDLGVGASKRKWSVFSNTGREQDFYQGQTINLLATDNSYQLYYSPAGAMVGELAGVEIQVVDDDMDGVYGTLPPLAYGHFGMATGSVHTDFDSIRIDGAKKAVPFSSVVNLGSAGWYKIQSQNGGNEIVGEPYTFKTGTLQLKGRGVKPDYFIVKGTGDVLGNAYFDISGGKKVEVPVGRYELAWGLARKGKKMQLVKSVIRAGDRTPVFDVTEGENTEVAYGSPYKFDFSYEAGADSVTVDGLSVVITGAGGEIYDRFYQMVPEPEAAVRKKGSKRPSDTLKMRPAKSNQEIDDYGWKAMWKPLSGEMKKKGDEVEVQLTEKKNPLFGKVESDWK